MEFLLALAVVGFEAIKGLAGRIELLHRLIVMIQSNHTVKGAAFMMLF